MDTQNENKDNLLNNEIERKAKEKLKRMDNQAIKEKANLEKKSAIKCCILSAVLIFFAVAWIISFSDNTTNDSSWFPLVLAICALIGIIVLLVNLFITLNKSKDKLALLRLKKELKESGVIVPFQPSDVEYTVSKKIEIATNKKAYRLLFDDNNKVFQLQDGNNLSKLYKFTDVISYEVYENGASKVSGTAGKALIGGAFFGLGGMVVGSSMGRTIRENCSQLKLLIRLNDGNNPQMEIIYISSRAYRKDSSAYKTKVANLQLVCSHLEYVINSKTLEESSNLEQAHIKAVNNDIKNQLHELQEMCKDGLITEEEYEQKKKQLLGL